MDDDAYHEWTPCEMYGHLFKEGWCACCGDRLEDDKDDKKKDKYNERTTE